MPIKYKLSLESTLKPSRIDLEPSIRKSSIDCLGITLATISDLKSHVKQAHWAVKGTDYYQLHTLFDDMAGELDEYIDSIAERISILGGTVKGTNKDSCENTLLTPYPDSLSNGMSHVNQLADDYALTGKHLRQHIKMLEELGDYGTMDMYVEMSLLADKRLWFLESHLQ